jgi:peptide/nickel transport system substrate-binding protein
VAGELHLAVREDIKTLNPYLVSNRSEEFAVSLLYDTLLDDDPQAGLQPNLAQRWELAPDGMSLTFWLHPQARWHDGQPVTAQDVAFSFQLVQREAFAGFGRLVALVDRVEAVSSDEVKFTLLARAADATRLLGATLRIVPQHVWEKIADPLRESNLQRPIGSGSFAFVELSLGKQLVLRNAGGHPAAQATVERVVIEVLRDEDKALQALKDGKLDALGWDVTPQIASEALKPTGSSASIQRLEAPGMDVQTLLLNLRKPPYDNHVLREALAQAVDTQSLIKAVLLGFGDSAGPDLFPPTSPWRNSSIAPVSFDPQQAGKKLEAAGFRDSNGDGLREGPDGRALQIPILCPNEPASLRAVEAIVANWKAVGIASKAAPLTQDALLPALMQAQFDAALYSLSLQEPDAAFFHLTSGRGLLRDGHVSGLNFGGYSNAEFDELAAASQEESDPEKRRELLLRMQAILAADLPQIPLYVPRVLGLCRDDRFAGWSAEPGVGLLSRATVVKLYLR